MWKFPVKLASDFNLYARMLYIILDKTKSWLTMWRNSSMNFTEIKSIRKRMKLGQLEFAQLFGVHPMTVSKWENGKLEPSAYQVELIKAFKKGAEDREVRDVLKNVLIGAGVVAAIALLLNYLKE